MTSEHPHDNETLLGYQAHKLKDLIAEILDCCEERKLYETQKFGVPYAELKCLMLFRGQRYLTVKGMAEKLEVAKSRIIKIAKGLMDKGLLESGNDPKDGRIRLFNLTREGKRKSEEVMGFENTLYRKILSHMDPHERKELLSYLDSLRSAMEAVKEEVF